MKNTFIILICLFFFCFSAIAQNNVTFQVDMSSVDPLTFTTPEVNGTFNGWCGNCATMSDPDGDNIWDVTIALATGSYEFKYSADNWSIQESLLAGSWCTVTAWGFTNRTLTVFGDTTLPVVCWESCDACVLGCTDPSALNYDSLASTDDGSCILTVDLSLQGIIDFTVPSGGSNGKAIHLVALQDIPDLSIYGIGVANNGGGSDGEEYIFDSISVLAGDDILLARSPFDMSLYFDSCYIEFDHVLTAPSSIDQNGDDAIELFLLGNIVETFGDINVDGSGTSWEYMDSWAYKDNWSLVWEENFSGNSLDQSVWTHEIGTGSQYGLWGWGNGELQFYQAGNTVVSGGTLKIIAKEEPNGLTDSWGNTMYYSSSRIKTDNKFMLRYGKIEARIKTVNGQGFWPAFWMLPSGGSWPCDGEIDIMEQWGNDWPTNQTTGAAHIGACPGQSFYQSFQHQSQTGSYASDFHLYGIEWEQDYIAWYVDGVKVYQISPSSFPTIPGQHSWPFNTNDWYLILNLAITQSGPNSLTIFPSQIEIDYIKVYESTSSSVTFSGGNWIFGGVNCTDGSTTTFNSSCPYPICTITGTLGCIDSLALNYDSSATIDDGSCIYCVYGCTDSLAINYDVNATCDDGSCTYSSNCTSPKPTGLYAYDVIDTRAKIGWDNMNDPNCMVWKYFVRYREVGTSQWTTKSAGVGNGLCNFGLNTVTKQLLNLTPSTTYEFRMKAFYCGGTSSNYSQPVQFTTADVCPDMTNLTTTTFNGNQAKVRFNWDTTGAYTFARILLRVDTAGSAWQTAGGFGIFYPQLFVNKFGLTPGQSYRAQGRTFCDSNITAYRSPTWTSPIFWTQPGSIREGGGLSINNLDIYPNPSRDVFNVTFNSDEKQDLKIRILSIVGAEVYREDRENFIGEYTKQVSLVNYGKGIYFLEIETNNGIINKKLIIQ